MNCKKCLSIIEEYLEDSLDPQLSNQAGAHIRDCESCRTVYEQLRTEEEIYSRYLLNIKEKPESWDAVRREIRKENSAAAANRGTVGVGFYERFSAVFFRRPLVVTMAALVLMLGTGFGLWYLTSVQKDDAVSGVASLKESSANPNKNDRTLHDSPSTGDGKANLARDEFQILEDHKGRTGTNALTRNAVHSGNGKKLDQAINSRADTIKIRPVSFDSSEAAFNRHLEKCEMVLRSFRNAVQETDKSGLDISYERRLAKELLKNSVRFRIEAQSEGNLPIESLLVDLEAILGSISKLPNRVTSSDANLITGRIQESGIIAKLQIQSLLARNSE